MAGKYNFAGKVAVVTGSSSGIGAAIATQLALNGASVVITGRNAANLDKVAKKIEEVTGGAQTPLQVIGNLTDESFPKQLIDEAVAKFGQLDVLINNAGGATPETPIESPSFLAEFDSNMNLNVRTVLATTQQAVPHLVKTKGNVINVSSIAGLKAYPGLTAYCAAKAALDHATRVIALELGPRGVRVNSISPGPTVTAFARSLNLSEEEGKDWYDKMFVKNSLMKRIGEVDDIANLALFLASDDAKNITGSKMVSDSGFMVQ